MPDEWRFSIIDSNVQEQTGHTKRQHTWSLNEDLENSDREEDEERHVYQKPIWVHVGAVNKRGYSFA